MAFGIMDVVRIHEWQYGARLVAGRDYNAIKTSFESALGDDRAELAKVHVLMVIHCK